MSKTYDSFISQLDEAPSFPQDVYGKMMFRVNVEKFALSAFFLLPLIVVLAGFLSFSTKTDYQSPLDFMMETEEVIFSFNFYSLFD
jgi:hypothetical protein